MSVSYYFVRVLIVDSVRGILYLLSFYFFLVPEGIIVIIIMLDTYL